jgi:hypothetical protein
MTHKLPDGLTIHNIISIPRVRRPPPRYVPDPDTEIIDDYSCSSEDDLNIQYTDDEWIKEEEEDEAEQEEEEDDEEFIPETEEDDEYVPEEEDEEEMVTDVF